jgi:hypothetical protein
MRKTFYELSICIIYLLTFLMETMLNRLLTWYRGVIVYVITILFLIAWFYLVFFRYNDAFFKLQMSQIISILSIIFSVTLFATNVREGQPLRHRN